MLTTPQQKLQIPLVSNAILSNLWFICFGENDVFELFYRIVAKNVVQNVPPGVAPIIAAGTQYMISQGGLQYFAQQPAVYGYEEQQILPLRIPHMVSSQFSVRKIFIFLLILHPMFC